MRARWMVAFGILFQVGIVAGMVLMAMMPLLTGQELLLETVPRDPRSLLRGNYVELDYHFSRLGLSTVDNHLDTGRSYRYGDHVYLEMQRRDSTWRVAAVWPEMVSDTAVYIRAIVHQHFGSTLDLRCGIESYFTDRENALALERRLRGRESSLRPFVRVMVAPSGQARIKSLETRE